jgi:hypothetical protein
MEAEKTSIYLPFAALPSTGVPRKLFDSPGFVLSWCLLFMVPEQCSSSVLERRPMQWLAYYPPFAGFETGNKGYYQMIIDAVNFPSL